MRLLPVHKQQEKPVQKLILVLECISLGQECMCFTRERMSVAWERMIRAD